MKIFRAIFCCLLFLLSSESIAQTLPSDHVVSPENLSSYLKDQVKNEIGGENKISENKLAVYFRNKFAERFFYDWHSAEHRFNLYTQLYNNRSNHDSRALDHMQKYADSTQWVLPFEYLNGEAVNAYALRHLARQHKMLDIAYQYFYNDKDPKYIRYFINQMNSLNVALDKGQYEKIEDGNGVYEVFRSGYRILNWLSIHNLFLGQEQYNDRDQLTTIATLLQHGQDLYENNQTFHSGNHQTRGMSALAMLSILLKDFSGTDQWYKLAMDRLEEHLEKEINDDGFQFERSVHYHMSDISNYFYVYQLAKISNIPISEVWEEKLRSLFTTLTKIAYPDKSAPVLQDDTENPWAEKNDISGPMTLGYLLFEDPEFGYFAREKVEANMYWFIPEQQLNQLKTIKKKKPEYGSLAFPETNYYIMRQGWDKNDKMMIITAGLDEKKPDHQHGDMLGIQAYANGHVILPNYQVRYSLPDFDFFKNSMVKNVALVDDELQGKIWTSNKGGSGFGKFGDLPNPKTILWAKNAAYDAFIGSHDGFENIGVEYSRQVLFVKEGFWIVKDNFKSNEQHTYKQIWQGHYTQEHAPGILRSVFDDASGVDILQLGNVSSTTSSGVRGKEWTIVSEDEQMNFQFITAIYPYRGYDHRIDEESENIVLDNWKINDLPFEADGNQLTTFSREQESFLFNTTSLSTNNLKIDFENQTDIFIKVNEGFTSLHALGIEEVSCTFSENASCKLGNKSIVDGKVIIAPGNVLKCKTE